MYLLKGEELWVLVIGKITGEDEPLRPHVKYVGNMHGNEVKRKYYYLYFLKIKQFAENRIDSKLPLILIITSMDTRE